MHSSSSGRGLLGPVLFVFVLALVAGVAALQCTGDSDPQTPAVPGDAGASREPEEPREAADLASEGAAADSRETLEGAAQDGGSEAVEEGRDAVAGAAATREVQGQVLDARGAGVAGVPVRTTHGRAQAVSDAAGRFEIALTGSAQGLVSASPEWATLRRGEVPGEGQPLPSGLYVVVAPAITVSGTVQGVGSGALAGADVVVDVPVNVLTSFPHSLEGTSRSRFAAVTDERGAFRLTGVPAVDGLLARASADKHKTAAQEVPRTEGATLAFQLEPEAPADDVVTGIVVHADGRPAEGATVRLGMETTLSAADGTFSVEYAYVLPKTPLVAALVGHMPAVIEEFAAYREAQDGPVRLVLGEESRTIAGRVLDAQGEGLAGWSVRLADALEASSGLVPPVTVEAMAAGRASHQDAVVTDSDGRFEIGGLLDKSYVLQAWNPRTLVRVESGPIPAGEDDAKLRVGGDLVREVLRGRVVSASGLPVEGVKVTVVLVTASTGSGSFWSSGESTTTDANGAFELGPVPRRGVHLGVSGEDVMPDRIDIDEGTGRVGADDTVEVSVRLRLRFQVEGGGSGATHLEVRGEGDTPLNVFTFESRGWSSSTRVTLKDGSSHVLAVDEGARELVVFEGSVERNRIPLQLRPGEVTRVSL